MLISKLSSNTKNLMYQYFICFLGSILYAIGFNLFVFPYNLYSGGIFGICQLLYYFIQTGLGLNGLSIKFVSVLYFIFNIPLLMLLYKIMKKSFFYKTLFTVIVQSLALIIIPIPSHLIVENRLAAVITGGFLSGTGLGMVLKASSSSGGLDIVGIYFARRSSNISVGKIALIVNFCIYIISGFLFGVETAIYSCIFSIIISFIMDRFHIQNISTTALVITRQEELAQIIMSEMNRGSTIWDGIGGYTKQDAKIILTVISKYQKRLMTRIVRDYDPNAFIIYTDNTDIHGNFQKRLDE